MVNWGAAVPIVVAIIGISGVILPAFSSVFINQIYNKPTINIDIRTKPERGNIAFFSFLYLYILVAESVVFIYVGHIRRGRKRRGFLQQITKQMTDVRKSLRRDLLTPSTLPVPLTLATLCKLSGARPRDVLRRLAPLDGIMPSDAIWQVGVYYGAFLNCRRHIDNRNLIREINDFIRVDDFYSKLVERDSYIKYNEAIDDFRLAELNRQCLELAADALEKIDWSKYGLGR